MIRMTSMNTCCDIVGNFVFYVYRENLIRFSNRKETNLNKNVYLLFCVSRGE